MSELKAIQIPKITNIFGRVIGVTEYYLKSEADKVIAELKEKHKTEIKELLCLIRDKENNFNRAFDSVEKELRHQKYKRCMEMATICFERSPRTALLKYDKKSDFFINFYDWWGNRWLELAEKFK